MLDVNDKGLLQSTLSTIKVFFQNLLISTQLLKLTLVNVVQLKQECIILPLFAIRSCLLKNDICALKNIIIKPFIKDIINLFHFKHKQDICVMEIN